MVLEGKRIVLTGGAGGIGQLLAQRLVDKGALVGILDRDAMALAQISQACAHPRHLVTAAVDLLDETARNTALAELLSRLGGIDVLINNAGIQYFKPFVEQEPVELERLLRLNLAVPMLLIRGVLPSMLAQGSGQIVNVGSTFGSIGFAWFAAYSASKAGLRGLSEALRRELRETGVGVTYIAPRAARTPLNTSAVMRMAVAVKMNMDAPEWVAQQIVRALERERKEVYLGFPESWFVRVNAVLPRLVDLALRGQNRLMERFARETSTGKKTGESV